MVNSNLTAPINLNNSKKSKSCNEKCGYTYSYPTSNLIYEIKEDYLSFKPPGNEYDGSAKLYRSYYNLKEIRVYRKGLHTYNNSKTEGEMHIIHTNTFGSGEFIVCIPIIKNSGEIPDDQKSVNDLFREAATLGRIDRKKQLSLANFNLNDLIKKKPYFYYIGTDVLHNERNVSYIVFEKSAAIKINPNFLTNLSNYFKEHSFGVKTNDNVFYNRRGPTHKTKDGDDIYISCHPTDSSGKVLMTKEKSYNVDNVFKDFINNVKESENPVIEMIQALLGAVIMIVFIFIMYKMYELLSRGDKPASGAGIQTGTTSNPSSS